MYTYIIERWITCYDHWGEVDSSQTEKEGMKLLRYYSKSEPDEAYRLILIIEER